MTIILIYPSKVTNYSKLFSKQSWKYEQARSQQVLIYPLFFDHLNWNSGLSGKK